MRLNNAALGRIAGFTAHLAMLLAIYLTFTMFDLLPPGSRGIRAVTYSLQFLGILLGAALCPFFLPLPGGPGRAQTAARKPARFKTAARPYVFLAAVFALNLAIRFSGVEFWLGSRAAQIAMIISSGAFFPISYGLFFLSWMPSPRWMRYCPLAFALALLAAVFARYYSVPAGGVDPGKALAGMFAALKWVILAVGAASAACVYFLSKGEAAVAAAAAPTASTPANAPASADAPAPAAKTGRGVIVRLIAMSMLFCLLNSIIGARLFPLVSGVNNAYEYWPLAVFIAVVPLCLLAGRSVNRFNRIFLPFAIVLFSMLPGLPLFHWYPAYSRLMATLAVIMHYTTWIVFSVSVVEHYRGRFWFYFFAVTIYLSYNLSFIVSSLLPSDPVPPEFATLISVILAVLFAALSFRILLPKAAAQQAAAPQTVQSLNINARFKERKLTEREADVARLIVEKGLSNKDISDKLNLARGTVEQYVSSIFRKFNVKSRAEFVSLFVSR